MMENVAFRGSESPPSSIAALAELLDVNPPVLLLSFNQPQALLPENNSTKFCLHDAMPCMI